MNEIEELELKISKFLRVGVIVAGVFMLAGWIASFQLSGDPFKRLNNYSSSSLMDSLEVHFMSSEWGILISYLGLFLLISLPVIRVFLTAFLFVKEKEVPMSLLSLLVLIGLMVSFSLGIVH